MNKSKQTLSKKKLLIRNLIWSGIIITSIGLLITVIDCATNISHSIIPPLNPNNLWYPTGFWGNIWHSLSTFTVQSNILVLVFFILSLINYINKNKFKNINHGWVKLAVTIYISITFVIFWAALFKPLIDNTNFEKSLDVMNFLNTFLLHLFTPAIMIIFYFVTAGHNKWATKTTWTKTFPITISYMFIYLFYVLIKGSFVGQITIMDWGARVVNYSYPYFFLNVKENLSTFFLYFFLILMLFVGLFVCYYLYNNWKYDNIQEKAAKKAKGQQVASKSVTK